MARPRKYPDFKIIAALEATRGMVYAAARRLGCHPDTIHDRAKVSRKVKECMDFQNGIVKDVCESKLLEHIKAGNLKAIMFYLARKGRERGYGDTVERGGNVEASIALSPADRAALIGAIAKKLAAIKNVDTNPGTELAGDAG
jgi:hypothetical protein